MAHDFFLFMTYSRFYRLIQRMILAERNWQININAKKKKKLKKKINE